MASIIVLDFLRNRGEFAATSAVLIRHKPSVLLKPSHRGSTGRGLCEQQSIHGFFATEGLPLRQQKFLSEGPSANERVVSCM